MNKKITLTLLSLVLSSHSINAQAFNDTEITIRTFFSKEDFMFDTPAAHSILDWQGENVGVGLDIKHDLSEKSFTELELDYSEVKGGEAHDDDISNKAHIYSKGGISGSTKDVKLIFGHKFNLDQIGIHSFSIAPTFGGFYKNVNYYSENKNQLGYVVYNGIPLVDQLYAAGKANETDSDIFGATLGFKIESENISEEKSAFKFDLLLPIHYHGSQIWHKRVPKLHWELENRKKIDPLNNNGFRIKYEKSYLIDNYIIKSIKFYSSFEKIVIKNLKETEPNWVYNGKGRTEFEGFKIGVGLGF